jgi:hypothetical protein
LEVRNLSLTGSGEGSVKYKWLLGDVCYLGFILSEFLREISLL